MERLIVRHHPTKSGVDRHCDSGNIMGLVCHIVLEEHVIEGSCDFMGKSPHRHCGGGGIMFLVGLMISQDRTIKGLSKTMVKSL